MTRDDDDGFPPGVIVHSHLEHSYDGMGRRIYRHVYYTEWRVEPLP